MILLLYKDNYYVIDEDMKRMAKDLPADTSVFCLDELYSGYPEFRRSSAGDNCHGCQPIIFATKKMKGVELISREEALALKPAVEFLDGDRIEERALKKRKK